ncbi:uncharacterized protein LOC114521945 [Dendronephthya gigantea]|uniref:uncharacterized protein LOC114521945 n=1 Tax=Dendronephthya gigantea TaxID=151771 RepID=UPI00106D0926|nr:uncharacterized protein LOC114521945 [Dendronephthya gigantea]
MSLCTRKSEEYKNSDSVEVALPPELKWNLPIRRSYNKDLGCVDFGEFGNQNVKVALMRCAEGPIDAVIAVKNAVDILNPKVVLFVGICASMKPEKVKLGDVVISAKLGTYAEEEIRQDGTDEWRDSLKVEVHRNAVMLSDPELVNNLKRRQEMLNYFKDSLGLEMEGVGLYAAAYNLGIEWAVVKGVSSFADGNVETKKWKQFASVMAASVVYNMFKYPNVSQSWCHKQLEPL